MPIATLEAIKPVVAPGDPVRFWTFGTGLEPQTGTVCKAVLVLGRTYAEIERDAPPHGHVFLFERSIWGFERIREGR